MDAAPTLLTLAHFEPFVGQTFGAAGAAGASTYRLVAATPLSVHDYPGRTREPFKLTFHTDTSEAMQGTRLFDLPDIGLTEIFLVPVEQAGGVTVYEAIFN